MIVSFAWGEKVFNANLLACVEISTSLRFNADNPNCYYAEQPKETTIEMGSFIGEVSKGGSVNYSKVSLTPHGNGTHTESYGHLSYNKRPFISDLEIPFLLKAQLILP